MPANEHHTADLGYSGMQSLRTRRPACRPCRGVAGPARRPVRAWRPPAVEHALPRRTRSVTGACWRRDARDADDQATDAAAGGDCRSTAQTGPPAAHQQPARGRRQGRSQGGPGTPSPIPLKILGKKRVRTTHALHIRLIEL